jgi:hypothetical protein
MEVGMKVSRGRSLAIAGTLAVSLLLAISALAAPLMVGDTQCGDLKKKRTETGVSWQVVGCAPLEQLVNASPACNNGVLDAGEFCDPTASPTGCGTETCVGCVECRSGPVVTPTPAPGATPTPPPVLGGDCADGELPPIGVTGGNEFGTERGIADGATHRFCFTLNVDAVAVDFNGIDATGAQQCFWATTFGVTPPLGSGLFPETDFGRNPHLGYFRSGELMPRGTYVIAITARTDSGCGQRYKLSARWR